MTYLIFTLDLVDDQLGITISFKVSYPHLLSELEANELSIVLSYIIGTRLYQRECTRKDVIIGWNKYYPHSSDNLAFWSGSWCTIGEHLPYIISWSHVGFDNFIQISSCSFEVSKIGWAAKKSTRAWPLMPFWGTKVMSYWDSNMAQLANLVFIEHALS